MSSRGARALFEDIVQSSEAIREFLGGRRAEDVQSIRIARSAIERELLIIAEASTRLGKTLAELPEVLTGEVCEGWAT